MANNYREFSAALALSSAERDWAERRLGELQSSPGEDGCGTLADFNALAVIGFVVACALEWQQDFVWKCRCGQYVPRLLWDAHCGTNHGFRAVARRES